MQPYSRTALLLQAILVICNYAPIVHDQLANNRTAYSYIASLQDVHHN